MQLQTDSLWSQLRGKDEINMSNGHDHDSKLETSYVSDTKTYDDVNSVCDTVSRKWIRMGTMLRVSPKWTGMRSTLPTGPLQCSGINCQPENGVKAACDAEESEYAPLRQKWVQLPAMLRNQNYAPLRQKWVQLPAILRNQNYTPAVGGNGQEWV